MQPITLTSRLPNVGTTIFTVMSALASETGAVAKRPDPAQAGAKGVE